MCFVSVVLYYFKSYLILEYLTPTICSFILFLYHALQLFRVGIKFQKLQRLQRRFLIQQQLIIGYQFAVKLHKKSNFSPNDKQFNDEVEEEEEEVKVQISILRMMKMNVKSMNSTWNK